MQGVFVMLDVARREHVVVAPDEKAEDAGEQNVQHLCFEDRIVDQLVGAVVEEDVEGAVQEQDEKQGKQRQVGGGVPGSQAGGQNEGQMADDLQRSLPIVALIERIELVAGYGNAVPVYLDRFSILQRQSVGRHLDPL